MEEALSTYDALVLEKNWITHDPKSFLFANFVFKTERLLSQLTSSLPAKPAPSSNGYDKAKHNKKKKTQRKHDPWKFVAPKNNEPRAKVEGKSTYYWCPKTNVDCNTM